jgi:hypothetical protein
LSRARGHSDMMPEPTRARSHRRHVLSADFTRCRAGRTAAIRRNGGAPGTGEGAGSSRATVRRVMASGVLGGRTTGGRSGRTFLQSPSVGTAGQVLTDSDADGATESADRLMGRTPVTI